MDFRHVSLFENNSFQESYVLPLKVTITVSCLVFRYIARPFTDLAGIATDQMSLEARVTPEETYNILNNLGLDFLTYSGPFFAVIFLYLLHVQNLTSVVDLNLGVLDSDAMMLILERLRFLIKNHEILFEIMYYFSLMLDDLDIDIDYEPEFFHLSYRLAGDRLLTLYRRIERELGLGYTDLPIH
jgi:hypothetical protein